MSVDIPVYSIELFGLLPTLNKMLRMHWRARQRHSAKWRQDVATASLAQRAPALDQIALHCVRYGPRIPDADNLIASFKPLVDGLVDAGVIKDDSPQYLSATYEARRCAKGQERVVLTWTVFSIKADGRRVELVEGWK